MRFKYSSPEARKLVKLKNVQLLLELLKSDNPDLSKYDLCDKITNKIKQFRLLRGHTGSAYVLINKVDKVVVKLNGEFNKNDKFPSMAIPTAVGWCTKTDSLIRIQPIAIVTDKARMEAMTSFSRASRDQIGYDYHKYNVGKYNGKFVVIDW